MAYRPIPHFGLTIAQSKPAGLLSVLINRTRAGDRYTLPGWSTPGTDIARPYLFAVLVTPPRAPAG